MKKIVVASDSFKGSVSSIEVAECAELAIHKVFPDCEVGWGWGRRYRGDFDYGDGWRSRILCRT